MGCAKFKKVCINKWDLKMFKVNYMCEDFPSVSFFKIFKTKEQADVFVDQLGNKLISVMIV